MVAPALAGRHPAVGLVRRALGGRAAAHLADLEETMSEYWGYVCLSHDPPIVGKRDLNHGDDALIDLYWKVVAGDWPMASELVPGFEMAYEGELAPMVMDEAKKHAVPVPPRQGGGTPPYTSPLTFLQQHPNCTMAVQNEYGDRRWMQGTIQPASAAKELGR
jgi:hypothetical protein